MEATRAYFGAAAFALSVLIAFALSIDFTVIPIRFNPFVLSVGLAVGVVAMVLILALGGPRYPFGVCLSCGNVVPEGAVQYPFCGVPLAPPPRP